LDANFWFRCWSQGFCTVCKFLVGRGPHHPLYTVQTISDRMGRESATEKYGKIVEECRKIKYGWTPCLLKEWTPHAYKPQRKHLEHVCKERGMSEETLRKVRSVGELVEWLAAWKEDDYFDNDFGFGGESNLLFILKYCLITINHQNVCSIIICFVFY
jgi:hypothetical protein